VSKLPEEAQLFFRALLLIVDDWGRCELDIDIIRLQCFPRQLDAWPTDRIEKCLAATEKALNGSNKPLVKRYGFAGKEYLQVENFGQRIQSKSKCPDPNGSYGYPKGAKQADLPLKDAPANGTPTKMQPRRRETESEAMLRVAKGRLARGKSV
jgi:hypothetical protein